VGGGQFCGVTGAQEPAWQVVTSAVELPNQQLIPSFAGDQPVVLTSGVQAWQIVSGGEIQALMNVSSIRQPGMQSPFSQTAPVQHWSSP
jgi:hypothetical protein